MDKSSSTSSRLRLCLRTALLALVSLLCPTLASCAGSRASFASYSGYAISPADTADAYDRKWADYLITHLARRTEIVSLVRKQGEPEALRVVVDYDTRLDSDYKVNWTAGALALSARNKEAMLWLLYQFMSAAGEDDRRLSVADLPPALLSMTDDASGRFAFEYRGIYSPSNHNEDFMPIIAAHNVDYDWGLWGHNLRKLFGGQIPEQARAIVDGHRVADQFCFSSATLYDRLVSYIADNYGPGEPGSPVRFAILPEDNAQACTCPACRKAGNTTGNASPAVARLLTRLAHKFPNQQFFTSAYLSTRRPPATHLPANAGVIVSAIDWPMQAGEKGKAEKAGFIGLIGQWKRVTPLIYVWDYVRNFDDYLTPYPCLHLLQDRLRLYREEGIRGVFLNGSGYDYATFDDVQTFAASALMTTPSLPVDTLVARYFRRYYPTTGDLLSTYYTALETRAAGSGKPLPFYGGIDDAVAYGLDPQEFETFVKALDGKAKQAGGEERQRLNKLLTALQFTRLELLRRTSAQYDGSQRGEPLAALHGHTAFDDMKYYREAHGLIDDYLQAWADLLRFASGRDNRLAGVRLHATQGGEALTALTDGLYGLPSDYHTNWIIRHGGFPAVTIPAGSLQAGAAVEMSFLDAPLWHIYAPARVELWQDGRQVAVATPEPQAHDAAWSRAVAHIGAAGIDSGKPVELRVVKPVTADARCQMACDEIYAHF